MGTARHSLGNVMKCLCGRPVLLGLLMHGRQEVVDLNTSTDLLVVKPTSGIQPCTKARLQSKIRRHLKRATTSWKIWLPKPLSGSGSKSRLRQINHSLCTLHQGQHMLPTTCQKTGLISMQANLTKDTMLSVKKYFLDRNHSVLFHQMPFLRKRMQKHHVGKIFPKTLSRSCPVKWKSMQGLLSTPTITLVALWILLRSFRFSTTPSFTT